MKNIPKLDTTDGVLRGVGMGTLMVGGFLLMFALDKSIDSSIRDVALPILVSILLVASRPLKKWIMRRDEKLLADATNRAQHEINKRTIRLPSLLSLAATSVVLVAIGYQVISTDPGDEKLLEMVFLAGPSLAAAGMLILAYQGRRQKQSSSDPFEEWKNSKK